MSGWLEGYVALVTGGGSGIGRAVADRFVSEGASVTIVGRNHDRLAGAVKASPDSSRMHAVEADVRSSEQLHQAVGATVDRFGKLDTLVANAGIWDYQRQLTRLSAHELGRPSTSCSPSTSRAISWPPRPRGGSWSRPAAAS